MWERIGEQSQRRLGMAEDLKWNYRNGRSGLRQIWIAAVCALSLAGGHEWPVRRRPDFSGGTIALSNWTPEGFIGQVFKTIGRHLPPPVGVQPPSLWGTREALERWFGAAATSLDIHPRKFIFRYLSADHFLSYFRDYYGPIHKAFAALGDNPMDLEADLRALLNSLNMATDGSLVVPSEYIDVIIRKA